MPSEYFRLEQLMQEFDFISEEELNQNRRFQLLQFRDEEIAEFRNFKQVPPYEREIPRDTFVVGAAQLFNERQNVRHFLI